MEHELKLPAGFEQGPDLLAMGAELKAAFCLTQGGVAHLSPHHGDLDQADAFDSYRASLHACMARLGHVPRALVSDRHPEYRSAKLARSRAADSGLPLIEVQHHHAHVAACLADNRRSLDSFPVLGIVLDGLGWGDDQTIWGGEFLLADYRRCERLGAFKPVAMLGGDRAAREPWRNLYAHLMAAMGWAEFEARFGALELYRYLASKPRSLLDAMLRDRINAPMASSCGRLFDAMAAAVGLCRDRQAHEGEAPQRLEASVDTSAMGDGAPAYPVAIARTPGSSVHWLEPAPLWAAVLEDLAHGTPPAVMAARFHCGIVRALVAMTEQLCTGARFDTVALSGGCFQNRLLLDATERGLSKQGFRVLTHRRLPAHDGGLALGQASIAAAQLIEAA